MRRVKYNVFLISWQRYKKRVTQSFYHSVMEIIILNREIIITKIGKSNFEMSTY